VNVGIAVLSLGAGFFAAAVVMAVTARRRIDENLTLVVAVIGVSAVAAAFATGAPTGTTPVDVILRAAVGATAAACGMFASDRQRLVALAVCGAAVVVTGSASGWLVGAALGAAAAGSLLDRGGAATGALLFGTAAQALLRLDAWGTYGSAGAAAVALSVIAGIGYLNATGATRRTIRVTAIATGCAAVVCSAGLLVGLPGAAAKAGDAVALARAGLASGQGGDTPTAARQLDQAAAHFAAAHSRVAAWYAKPALLIPVIAQHARVLTRLTATGADLATAGAQAAQAADPARLRLAHGHIDPAGIAALAPSATRARASLEKSQRALNGVTSMWLLGRVAAPLEELHQRVDKALPQARTAELATQVAPALLGGDGARRYFVAIETPVEARASGGIVGNYAELTATDGHLALTAQGREGDLNSAGNPLTRVLHAPPDYVARYGVFQPERIWSAITLSPDFPTVAGVMADLYPQSGGRPVDGVISMDPTALAAVLQLVGSIKVPQLPEPITAASAPDLLLREQYIRFPNAQRVEFLAAVTNAVFDKLVTSDLPGPADLARVLGPMTTQRHLQLWAVRPAEQRLFSQIGADGALPPVHGDSLAVVNQNASANKIDLYLRRSVDYKVRVNPRTGNAQADLTVRLDNGAPSSGLPAYVINGNSAHPSAPGHNLTILTIYSPLDFDSATLDGATSGLQPARELGRNAYSVYIDVPPGGSRTLRVRLHGFVGRGAYRLDVAHQPTVNPDHLTVDVTPATGWRGGARLRRDQVAVAHVTATLRA
jgi:uncharacterized protein DUF4012